MFSARRSVAKESPEARSGPSAECAIWCTAGSGLSAAGPCIGAPSDTVRPTRTSLAAAITSDIVMLLSAPRRSAGTHADARRSRSRSARNSASLIAKSLIRPASPVRPPVVITRRGWRDPGPAVVGWGYQDREERTMASDRIDALVIFGATGDLAKLETFPALVGLVKRGVLNVPVIGVAKSGWGLEQFRDYAAASLKLNGMDPAEPAAARMLGLLRYVDGDLGDDATYKAMSDEIGEGEHVLYYLEVPPFLFGRIAQGIAGASRARGARVMGEKPFGTDLATSMHVND